MGKGDRKTKARQSRRKYEAMAGVALAPSVPRKPKKQGRARMAEIEQERAEDASRTVLAARARMMGRDPDSVTARAEMTAQRHGEAAGVALSLACGEDEAATLFDAYKAFSGAYERYTRRVLQTSAHARCGKIEMQPERLTTSAEDAPPDLRSEDERHRAAVNAWAEWRARLVRISIADGSAIWTAFHGFAELHRDGKVTPPGARFVEAMRRLHDTC